MTPSEKALISPAFAGMTDSEQIRQNQPLTHWRSRILDWLRGFEPTTFSYEGHGGSVRRVDTSKWNRIDIYAGSASRM
jgi:hypothetical protein